MVVQHSFSDAYLFILIKLYVLSEQVSGLIIYDCPKNRKGNLYHQDTDIQLVKYSFNQF